MTTHIAAIVCSVHIPSVNKVFSNIFCYFNLIYLKKREREKERDYSHAHREIMGIVMPMESILKLFKLSLGTVEPIKSF